MRNDLVRLFGAASMHFLICATVASASELPSRKPGLWEIKTSIEGSGVPARVVRQCIDPGTDQMLQSSAGPFNPAACPQRNVQRPADTVIIDSSCAVADKAATAHTVVTGSFDSAYTMTVTAQSEVLPGGTMTMTMDGKWIGACAADQKPGDVIMSNGVKINIPDAQKRALSPVDAGGGR